MIKDIKAWGDLETSIKNLQGKDKSYALVSAVGIIFVLAILVLALLSPFILFEALFSRFPSLAVVILVAIVAWITFRLIQSRSA